LLDRIFIQEKLQNWAGYFLIAIMAGGIGLVIAKQTLIGIGLFGLIVGFAVAMVCLINVETGLYINMIYCFFTFHFSRWFFNDTFPVGVVSDSLIIITFLGLFLKRINWRKSLNEFTSTSVIIWTLVLL